MDDHAHDRLPRLAPLLLIGALAGLAFLQPQHGSGDASFSYILFTRLTAFAVVGYVAWRFHGLVAAAAAMYLLHLVDIPFFGDDTWRERAFDLVFLGTLALGVAAGSQQGRKGLIPWVLLAIGASILAVVGWYGLGRPEPPDNVAYERLAHVTIFVAVMAVVFGWLAKPGSWRDRVWLVVVMLIPPIAGCVAFRQIHGRWPLYVGNGEWVRLVVEEWPEAIRTGTWDTGRWCWTAPWAVVPLTVLGIYRMLARGRRQLRCRQAPLGWLLAIATVGSIAALATTTFCRQSLALAAAGALLSIFGVADVVLALVERIELKPPDPGPSGVPRVK